MMMTMRIIHHDCDRKWKIMMMNIMNIIDANDDGDDEDDND